jgi:adenine deaminase
MSLTELVSVARGDTAADLLLKNARIVNTFTGTIEEGNVAIYKDRIAGIGDYIKAKQVINLQGSYLAPGLINGHTHIESSMLHPAYYAQAVVPRGTSTVITDLHEIANVAGIEGIRFCINWSRKIPLDIYFMVPSCVPATHMETSGAEITSSDIKKVLRWQNMIGLGELMNFPGVINGMEQVLDKIRASHGKIIDGHAPGVYGKQLNAYMSAGIYSDHECTKFEEAKEKLSRGMHIMIREGSSEKNLDELLPIVTDKTYKRCLFVVDDRSCADLFREGDIDAVVRKAIQRGLDPVRSIQMATINTAEYFNLYGRGGIGPGYIANLITINNIKKLEINMVFYKGKLVAKEGKFLMTKPSISTKELSHTINIKPFNINSFKLTTKNNTIPVIEIVPGQIITRKKMEKMQTQNGVIMPDIERDILKLVVVERHKATGNIGRAMVKGFGLKRGALASSIAHDSHNIISVGTNDSDILTAIKEVEKMQGGLVVCADGKI